MKILGTVASSVRRVPGAPTIGTATDVGTSRAYNNGAAVVTFTAPVSDGGDPITSYTVTSSPGGFTASGAASPLTVTGLLSSTSYTFTVVATNSRGSGGASAASNSITATTVPQAPIIGTATAGDTLATVTYIAGATGGKTVTAYTATSSPGSFTGTGASPITVSGLTNGTAYTFTVRATNANGTSIASSASNSVTPVSVTPVVTGGTLSSDATYYYRTFTTSGTLGITVNPVTCDVLTIGGGGSGGADGGGGGGAGQVLLSSNNTFSVGNRSVSIGATAAIQSSGNSSQFGSLTAATGGNAGGDSGGSGGSSGNSYAGGSGNTQFGISAGGGGGGSTAIGGNGNATVAGGNGGAGTNTYSSWASATGTGVGGFYAGGGGGGGNVNQPAPGGSGNSGGGSGVQGNAGGNATANTGSGGGGSGGGQLQVAGQGASGIVIVRYTRSQVGG
jgi:hypothetical protein